MCVRAAMRGGGSDPRGEPRVADALVLQVLLGPPAPELRGTGRRARAIHFECHPLRRRRPTPAVQGDPLAQTSTCLLFLPLMLKVLYTRIY